MRAFATAVLALALSGCADLPDPSLPPVKTFTAPPDLRLGAVSNSRVMRDFLDLTFQLESGRPLPVFTRFEGPVTVRLTGHYDGILAADLDRLLARLRDEAGIEISRLRGERAAGQANITIEAISGRQIRNSVRQAACFVAPNVSSFAEYRLAGDDTLDWQALRERRRLAVFVPSDMSPQEARDCLHEELGQALGPLNDLYRLAGSVFNDDNIQSVLTPYDMLLLKVSHDPALESGMTEAEVRAALPAILLRLNPEGGRARDLPAAPIDRAWITAIQSSLNPNLFPAARLRAAREAVSLGRRHGLSRVERGYAAYNLGRVRAGQDPAAALTAFLSANRHYAAAPGTELHRAHVISQIASFALASGDGETARRLVEPAIRIARAHQNAALLATLMLMRAEALELTGEEAEAAALRLDSLGWARYGFGPDRAVRTRVAEIQRLRPPAPDPQDPETIQNADPQDETRTSDQN
ncbi:DUF2927 domain-containing protein [Poseidonocella sedimentorum]|uniref:ATP-dependent transcriptional regulator n=1 Tax=Poseidonocella sedimentorum TaxID=871652 RepID=A0A1I6DFL9_9RHOB|nr:DUF2927 domain-containing protein [Poseidonocella sedimentorum]SFR04234.1 Protein of unknown function [Poseidonocella sedimentorum]